MWGRGRLGLELSPAGVSAADREIGSWSFSSKPDEIKCLKLSV
jgi:hypothetical protein